MVQFNDWCDAADSNVGTHGLRILSGDPVRLNAGVVATAAVVPTHYAAAERVAGILRRLGKTEAAEFVEGKLPTSKSIRSGDLGEILATEWIATQGGYGCDNGFWPMCADEFWPTPGGWAKIRHHCWAKIQ